MKKKLLVLPVLVAVAAFAAVVFAGSAPSAGSDSAYAEFTAPVTVTGTGQSDATTIVSSGPVTYTGAESQVEFFAPEVSTPSTGGNTTVTFMLEISVPVPGFPTTTMVPDGVLGSVTTPAGQKEPVLLSTQIVVPASGVTVVAYRSSGAGRPVVAADVGGGTRGGTDPLVPGFVRVTP